MSVAPFTATQIVTVEYQTTQNAATHHQKPWPNVFKRSSSVSA